MADYSAYNTKTPDGLLQRIAATASQQEAINAEVERLEEALKNTKDAYREISESALPALMEEAGLKEFTTLSGTKIKVQELVTANCPAPSARDPELMKRRSRIFKWLEENGYGKLISRELVVDFDKSEAAQVAIIEQQLRDAKLNVHQQRSVHPMTFGKFVRDLLADGKEVPEDFSVHRRNVAKIVKD